MDEKELKTSVKQRIFIGLIAVLMLGSIIAGYAAIILNGGSSTSTDSGVDEAKVAEYQAAYDEVQAKFIEATRDDYNKFIAYKGEIKAYNETSANEGGLQTRDLYKGSGDKITDDTEYLAYYVGWCADESVFDSSFDNNDNPTAFTKILDASVGMIEGWTQGVKGMHLDGVREITVPGELAYGDSMEICGGKNKPLKFIVMAKAKEEPLKSLAEEIDTAYMRLQYANYGLDYDQMSNTEE
ncbi:FKBP-type peptidyl-prolyl cis-trans isomerase [Candidatus Saccharibacteria bacterium]|nr:FKBP-type peptidyl-prolyl cis-trans isomerase [Candidatus Saccharibacteria bacterium]